MAIATLNGTVKHYDWGGKNFIPFLLNIVNEKQQPFAEYWLGVHPQADCTLRFPSGIVKGLREYVNEEKTLRLGNYVANHFGNIPYLFKALDVSDMLSIQVHPEKSAAEKDFAEESKTGIALSDPKRNYKDDNHKPELMVAMDDFWLLHGFRPGVEMQSILFEIMELNFLQDVFGADHDYRRLYTHIMELPQEEVNASLQPLIDRILPLYQDGKLERSNPNYWAAKAQLTFSQPGRIDRGIFSIYIFNLVHLKKGEAVFQDAGVPHAYLEGQNIEIMASSDNVLRGGLTSKHIDVKELLKHVKCEATHPHILHGEMMEQERRYITTAPDFELSSFNLAKGEEVALHPTTAEMLLLVSGQISLTHESESIQVHIGEPAALLTPGTVINLKALEDSLVYKASVPVIS